MNNPGLQMQSQESGDEESNSTGRTFLFTDIEGSTRLWERHPEAMSKALEKHDGIVRKAIEDNGGRVFKTVGDGFFACFDDTARATVAAVDIQLAVAGVDWLPLKPIRVRIAINAGEAQERDGDYFGQAPNRAARILAVGHGGQILVSRSARDLVEECLPSGITLLDLASHQLKDLGQPEHVWQIVHPSLSADFPPLRSLQAFANNIPAQLSTFIGRDKEMAAIRHLMSSHRLLTLTGSGGCGKTRLALQVAADVVEQFQDGVWLADLGSLSSGGLVVQEVAGAMGFGEEPGRPLLETLAAHLRSRSTLLILDNCEHVIQACADLVEFLLTRCASLTILATSREALGVAGERSWAVPTLPQPDLRRLGRDNADSAIAGFDSVRLFIDRASAKGHRFVLSPGNAHAVASICRRLDGIPPAIELAAARAAVLSIEQINIRLKNSLDLLTTGSRTARPRHKTLRAAIDWSYDLLSDPQKSMMCGLSVFANGFTLDAVEAVFDEDGAGAGSVVDVLPELVDKSLVHVQDSSDSTRYRLLEPLREYGRELLHESGTDAMLAQKHARHYRELGERLEPDLIGPKQKDALNLLDAEHENMRVALDLWCGPVFAGAEHRADEAHRLFAAAWRYWASRGYINEGREFARATLGLSGDVSGDVRAKALLGAGVLAWRQCSYSDASALLEESLSISRTLDDDEATANALNVLGLIETDDHSYERAETLFEECLKLCTKLTNRRGMGLALMNRGNVANDLGRYSSARKFYAEALPLLRSVGDVNNIAWVLLNSGAAANESGRNEEAAQTFEEVIATFRELGDRRGIAYACGNLAQSWLMLSQIERPRALLAEAISICRDLGDSRATALALSNCAIWARSAGKNYEGAVMLGAAAELIRNSQASVSATDRRRSKRAESDIKAAMGARAFESGHYEGAALSLDAAVQFALRILQATDVAGAPGVG